MDTQRKGKEPVRIELPMPPIPSADVADEGTLRRFLDSVGIAYLAILQDLMEREYDWVLHQNEADLSPFEDRHRAFLADGRIARVVAEWGEKTTDPLLRRSLEILRRRGLAARAGNREIVEAAAKIRRRLSVFRPELDGVAVPPSVRMRSLREDRSREDREEAYRALEPLQRELAPDVRKLFVLRNAAAATLGHPDAASLLLSLADLPADRTVALVESVEERTREPWRRSLSRVAESAGAPSLEPWDVPYGIAKLEGPAARHFTKREAATHLDRTFTELGFDVEELPIRIRDAEIPYGGVCFPFYRPRESRILVSPTDGTVFLRVLFHEYGHAVHNILEKEEIAVLAGADHGAYSESMAEIFAGAVFETSFHTRMLEIPVAEAEQIREALLLERLWRLRHRAMQFSFELRAYAAMASDPEADLDSLALETERKFLQIEPQGTAWATWAPLTTHPVYWQNYILGAVVADQTWAHLRKTLGGDPVGNREAGRILTESFLSPGALTPWPERLSKVFGCDLNPEALVLPRG